MLQDGNTSLQLAYSKGHRDLHTLLLSANADDENNKVWQTTYFGK